MTLALIAASNGDPIAELRAAHTVRPLGDVDDIASVLTRRLTAAHPTTGAGPQP